MILRTEDLTVGYGKTAVVNGLSVTVQPGEILTLIGANGAGKSTVLKTLAAQLRPLAGTVYLDKEELSGIPETALARQVALLLTDRIDPERMTCAEVVASGRYPYTGRLGILSGEDWRIVYRAMDAVRIRALADRSFHEISDGQRQRVMLARAVSQQPEILLLDEPTSYLDIRHKLELLTYIRQLAGEQGLAVVMSLHELDLAERVSDRILCIKDGKPDRLGTPEEIFKDGYIRALYGLEKGTFHALFGAPELPAVRGMPEVFVIGGGGAGIPVYRRLQRQGIPFATGVLQENDVDYPVAAALAAELIAEKPFELISPETFDRALQVIRACRAVICCCKTFGAMNEGNRRLKQEAEKAGLLHGH